MGLRGEFLCRKLLAISKASSVFVELVYVL